MDFVDEYKRIIYSNNCDKSELINSFCVSLCKNINDNNNNNNIDLNNISNIKHLNDQE